MRITIFSLGGLLGQYVTNTALLHGAQVTAYVPDAKAIWPRKNLTVIEGSLQNRERVLEALLEADAVISVLAPMRVKYVKEEETPLADGNAMILSAMKQLGKKRFVTVGHVCIHAFGDCEDKYQRMSTKFMQIFWPGVYKDICTFLRFLSALCIVFYHFSVFSIHSAISIQSPAAGFFGIMHDFCRTSTCSSAFSLSPVLGSNQETA